MVVRMFRMAFQSWHLLLGVILTFHSTFVNSHVSLTFPPSRAFSLDFLNTFWTQPPCGMPRGSVKTTFIAGSTVNVTWHLGYAHTGGYKLELLTSQGTLLADLTPTTDDNDFVQGRTTAQWHLVKFPSNITCTNCIVRLLRQVPEFSPAFAFWSCSDVDILHTGSYVETCSGRGKYSPIAGTCTCCKKRWGPRCQYEDECTSDADCSGAGKCLHLGGSALPRNQCFCDENHFGDRCEKTNPASFPKFSNLPDLTEYFQIPLGGVMLVYFKRLLGSTEDDDIIDFVVHVNGTSWAGIGWRPLQLGTICKSWPFIPDALDPNKEPTLVQVPRPPTTTALPDGNSSIASNASKEQHEVQYQYIPSEWAPQDPFTPMDCNDIVIGAAVGQYARIRDAYARGRHTPQPDAFWGGNDDLLGATGWEDGSTQTTTLIFRRRVRSSGSDGPDHPLKGDLLLTYARGQQPGEVVQNPAHQLEKGNPVVSDFYTLDEYKYHGLGEIQRGAKFMDFSATRDSASPSSDKS